MAKEKLFPVIDPFGIVEDTFRRLFPEAKVVPRDALTLLSEQKVEATEPKTEKASSELPLLPAFTPVSQLETVEYQKKELAKSLVLLETHLRQGGIMYSKPCECIEKHMLEVEALADETTGITGERFYQDVASWARQHGHKGTPQAVASGQYKNEYLDLASQARQFRKQILGTEISSTNKAAIKAKIQEFLRKKDEQPSTTVS